MEVLLDYIYRNFVLLIMIVGMFILTGFDVFLDKKMLIRLRVALIMLFALSVFDGTETLLAHSADEEWIVKSRILMSALCYSLRPLIVMMLVFITYRRAHRALMIPALVNIIASFSAFFTDIVYTINDENSWYRGPLGYMPYIISLVYIIILFLVSFRVLAKRSFEEGIIIMFLALSGSLAALLAAVDHGEVVNLTYGAEILLYYLYVYSQYTKRDALTGLYNRQSFYCDIAKHRSVISGVISVDMNELKWMNDTLGHEAGDKALRSISECFMECTSAKDRVYRIGGDEFVILCHNRTSLEIEKLVEDMREAVKRSGYSCAFGSSVNKTSAEMIKEADAFMYEDKARIKAGIIAEGGELHTRK